MSRVLAFFARRIVAALFILLVMITLTFFIYWAIPSQPASFVYPNAPHLTTYQIDQAHKLLGLDRPKIVQWADYLSHIARGDFGKQWEGTEVTGKQTLVQSAISPTLFAKTRVTASILLGGAFLVIVLALPLGAIAARFQNSAGDRLLSLLTLVAICLHPMVLGLILRTWFADQLHWLPEGGYCTFIHHPSAASESASFLGFSQQACGGPWPWAQHLILPWISFALLFLALYTRMSRASVLEVLHEDFVRTARAKGASESRVLGRHVLPNVGIRVLTMIGMEIGTAIGVCVYIESAFGMNGLGRYAVDTFAGTRGLDLPVVLAVVTMITVVVIAGNLIVDLLYAVFDPRVGGRTVRLRRTPGSEPVVV